MHEKPQGRGYVRLQETGDGIWNLTEGKEKGQQAVDIPAHEFHYSSLVNLPNDAVFAYDIKRGYGIDGKYDGLVYKNLLANFTHLRDVESNHWAGRFVNFIRKNKSDLG